MAGNVRVLVVAQTPPPHHGQGIMTQYFLDGQYQHIELHHVRMAFSDRIEQVGRAGMGKVWHLLALIGRIIAARFRVRPDVLYFPPAGPNLIPFLRDCAILISTRWLFPRTVFHFHAAGLPALYGRLPLPLKVLFRAAYGRPDLAISISEDGMRDAAFLNAKATALVPNGVPDLAGERPARPEQSTPTILFLGMVCEEKGAGVLIDACRRLRDRNIPFQCRIAGRPASEAESQTLRMRAAGLEDCVTFPGEVTGAAKWQLFSASDIFCFPTFYASESFGLVVVEAMMYGLPSVVSDWRALPEIVIHGETGIVTPARDAEAVSRALETLILDPGLRGRMGRAARDRYVQNYTAHVFCQRMEAALGAATRAQM
ncbi:MAG TPA: glycosyltransferase family 4 protein [Terrimicrobiaceae bacterium]|nr:glycosyltransferase family 4 protein [Terrimicrobiaceae bacterium]